MGFFSSLFRGRDAPTDRTSGSAYSFFILYLQIAECALKIDISFTQEIRNSRSVNLVRMTLGYNVHQIFQKIKY